MKKILIIDDEKFIQTILKKILLRKGIDCDIFENGKDALKYFKSNPSFDLILLDISLPDINGLDLIDNFREINKSIKIVVMSGYQKQSIDNIDNYKFDDFIFKPELTESINKILENI